MLIALPDVYRQAGRLVVVVHILFDVNIKPAQNVNQLRERRHINHDVLVNRNAKQSRNFADKIRCAAEVIQLAEPPRIAARRYPRVAGNGNYSALARLVGKTQQQNRIGFGTFIVVNAQNQNVRVAVEFRIGRTHTRRAAVVVALIQIRELIIDATARIVHRESDKQRRGTD